MSDNNKPDKAHNGSGGEGDGNRSNLFDRHSLEEVMPYLEWLILIVATTGFLAFQLIVDAIYEEQYERDVAWIARQSKCRSPLDEDEDDEDGDDDDFYDDDDDEELENLMDDESEDEMGMEMSAGATCVFDLGTCTGELTCGRYSRFRWGVFFTHICSKDYIAVGVIPGSDSYLSCPCLSPFLSNLSLAASSHPPSPCSCPSFSCLASL